MQVVSAFPFSRIENGEQLGGGSFEAGFFVEFAACCFGPRFADIDKAAGQGPQPVVVAFDEHDAIPPKNSGFHAQEGTDMGYVVAVECQNFVGIVAGEHAEHSGTDRENFFVAFSVVNIFCVEQTPVGKSAEFIGNEG